VAKADGSAVPDPNGDGPAESATIAGPSPPDEPPTPPSASDGQPTAAPAEPVCLQPVAEPSEPTCLGAVPPEPPAAHQEFSAESAVCSVPSGRAIAGQPTAPAVAVRPDEPERGAMAVPVRLDERPSRGDPAAPVVLVEYADFECPYCAQAAPVLHDLVESCDGLVRHVFRHFPIFEVHPYALTAALAAEVCHAHDRFWPMHDLMFAYQSRLKDVDHRMRAERLGLDPDLVVGAAAQPYGVAVEADYEHGVATGVRGTPTIFINGQAFRGRPELPALRRAVHMAATSSLVLGSAGLAGAGADVMADPQAADEGSGAGPAAAPAPRRRGMPWSRH